MLKKINHKIVPKEVVKALIHLYHQGEFLQILEKEKQFASLYQDSIELLNIFGSTNLALQNFKTAIINFNKAIKLNSNIPTIYYNLGLAYHNIGNMDDAIVNYKKAIDIKPDYDEALNNIGISLEKKGDFIGAIDKYNKVLAINPKHAGAYYNLGNVFYSKDNLILAIENFNRAIDIKPDYVDAYFNLGNALNKQGKLEEAIESFNRVLSIKPDFAKAYNNMGNILSGIIFKKPNKSLQNTIVSLVDKKSYVQPQNIAFTAISLLKFEPSLKKQLKFVSDDKIIQDPLNIISDLDKLPLLLKLMSVCPLPDLELEKLFKQLRASILKNISSLKGASPELLRFQSALALQCFTNEYVYSQSKNEEKALKVLERKIKEIIYNNEQPHPNEILILASYQALHKYDWFQSLIVTNQIQEVFTRQVEEPKQEEKLKLNIPVLGEINNKVS